MHYKDAVGVVDQLTKWLNLHSKLYYADGNPEVVDSEWDKKFKELCELEEAFPALALDTSPTKKMMR